MLPTVIKDMHKSAQILNVTYSYKRHKSNTIVKTNSNPTYSP